MKKRILSLLLALVLVMQFGIVAFAEESNRETSADYYSEQETKTGKEALSVIDIERVAKHYADVQEKNGYEVVSATKQTVYVIDTLNDRGEVYNSRLMIVTEALQYKSDLKLKGNTWVGEDGETHQGGKLSIFLVVYKDSSRNYYAYGTADWENGVYSGGINGPAAGYDFLAITWGGGGELKNTDRSISRLVGHSRILIADIVGNSTKLKGHILPTILTVMQSFKRHTVPIREKKQTFD